MCEGRQRSVWRVKKQKKQHGNKTKRKDKNFKN